MLPPAGRHLETGATEDCNLSQICVWNNFNSGHVVVIEQPDGAMLDTPVRVARNGWAGRVRSHAEISKSASAPVHSGKFKKQRVAPPKKKKNVRLEWKRIRRYRTCYGARLDDEDRDIAFDMYQKQNI